MKKILTHYQIWEYYNEILKNKYFVDKLEMYDKGKVRELAESIMNKQITGYELLCRDIDFVNKVKSEAEKEGYNKNILQYLLNHDPEYCQAETVIKLIEGTGVNTIQPVKGLGLNQIALIYFYERNQITRENAGGIAAKNDYTSKNSGEKLFQNYTKYCDNSNRKDKPILCTPKKLKNRIKLFESILNHLTDKARQWATDEIEMLKTIYETEYQ